MQTLTVNMLGEFSISFENNTIDDSDSRSKKPWILLEYLFTFRDKDISQAELIEMLWPEDNSDNPSNTLKTLLYRSRAILDKLEVAGDEEIIVSRRGTYAWNKNFNVIVDADVFEQLVNKPFVSNEQRTADLMEAVSLYRGDFLPKSSYEPWVIPISTYYHSMYMKAAHELINLLSQNGDYPSLLGVCEHASSIDPYDEPVHYSMVSALYHTGAQQKAMQHYEYVTDLFFSQFGTTPSREFTELYREITKSTNAMESDLQIIKENLCEGSPSTGAFFCEYAFFKDIYQIYARSALRSGQVVYICLLTASTQDGEPLPKKLLNGTMDRLKGVIEASLRRGDVFCRYSVTQYLLMLPTASFENSELVMKRVTRAFRARYPKLGVTLSYKSLPMDPIITPRTPEPPLELKP